MKISLAISVSLKKANSFQRDTSTSRSVLFSYVDEKLSLSLLDQ